MQLNLTNIHYTYAGSPREVLHGVTLSLPTGWTGIIGDNGCGKSTLARVAIGEHAPTSGQVFPHLLGAYCEQDCAVAPPELSDFACDYSREAIHLRDFILMGELVANDALHREESCGGHFREEHQTEEGEAKRDDENFFYVGCWEYQGNDEKTPELIKEPLEYEAIKVQTRNYKN